MFRACLGIQIFEAMLWKEKKSSRIRAIQMDNLRGLPCTRRMNRFPNARKRESCGVTKGVDERIDEGFLQWRGCIGIELLRESM